MDDDATRRAMAGAYGSTTQATAQTAAGVRELAHQNAEVIAHLESTARSMAEAVEHLDAIAAETRESSVQNRDMLRVARWTLIAAIVALVANVLVSALT